MILKVILFVDEVLIPDELGYRWILAGSVWVSRSFSDDVA
jgi:hypothetical protein